MQGAAGTKSGQSSVGLGGPVNEACVKVRKDIV